MAVALACFFGINHAWQWMDGALLSYSIILSLCVAVVVLSSIWWWRTDGTSTVFRMLILLLFGMGIDVWVQLRSRMLWIENDLQAFNDFRSAWIWEYRQAFELIALVYLLSVIVSRMLDKDDHYAP